MFADENPCFSPTISCCWEKLQCLERYGIPVPRYALVNREMPYQELDYFVEEEDFVEVHGNRFWKPFVEKPVDGKMLHLKNYISA